MQSLHTSLQMEGLYYSADFGVQKERRKGGKKRKEKKKEREGRKKEEIQMW